MTDREQRLAAVAAIMGEEYRDESKFVDAWRDAVELIGEQYFMLRAPLHECIDKWQMEPKVDLIRSRLSLFSTGEKIFVQAVIQFYNDRALPKHDLPTMTDISASLDMPRLKIVMRLMRHYGGW